MTVSIIAAVAENGVIGRDGDLPWRLPEDLKRFKRLTMGHSLVMGRKTFESIGRPLPGRTTIVVTRQAGYAPEGVQVAHSVDEALSMAEGDVFVAGGAEIYRQTIERADRIYLTRIHASVDGDTFFPEYDASKWEVESEARHEGDPYDYTFVDYVPSVSNGSRKE